VLSSYSRPRAKTVSCMSMFPAGMVCHPTPDHPWLTVLRDEAHPHRPLSPSAMAEKLGRCSNLVRGARIVAPPSPVTVADSPGPCRGNPLVDDHPLAAVPGKICFFFPPFLGRGGQVWALLARKPRHASHRPGWPIVGLVRDLRSRRHPPAATSDTLPSSIAPGWALSRVWPRPAA